jgi:predicted DNA-binding protein (MmcQ/YjbR family)
LEPSVLLYKVGGKMFAILAIRGFAHVIVKCDPYLAQTLREKYRGIGHRSHLDRRHWISIELEADVPMKEIRRLVEHSYQLVFASLTRKQRATIAAAPNS